MRYLTAEELKTTHKDEAHDILDECEGHMTKLRFGINAFIKWGPKIFPNRKDLSILDLGPASGGFEKQLTDAGYKNIYGVDIDNYLSKDAKPLLKELKLADLAYEKLPWPDNFFDVAIGWCILPHLENPFLAIREINRVLKPGGLFLFSVPHVTSKPAMDYFQKKRDFGSYRATNNHIIIFTPALIKKAILKYFSFLGEEYPVRPKIFQRDGFKGKLRAFLYQKLAPKFPKLAKMLGDRWAYDIIYAVQKQRSNK